MEHTGEIHRIQGDGEREGFRVPRQIHREDPAHITIILQKFYSLPTSNHPSRLLPKMVLLGMRVRTIEPCLFGE